MRLLALLLAALVSGVHAADVCVGKAFAQEAQWVGKQKRFRAFISDNAGCNNLNVSKLYWQGSCTDRENNFGNSSPNCGSKGKVTDDQGTTCKEVFAKGGADDFVNNPAENRNFDVGLICNPATGSSARNQQVYVFIRTSCANIAKVQVSFDEDKTDSCPARAETYSTRNDKGDYYGQPEKKPEGIFAKISKAIFGVIIAICILVLSCCVGLCVFVFLRRRRAAKANNPQASTQMQSGYGGGGAGGYPQGTQAGYGNQNYGGNTGGYQQPKSDAYEPQKPATGYSAGEAKPAGYPSAV